jgi:hypothetical protein
LHSRNPFSTADATHQIGYTVDEWLARLDRDQRYRRRGPSGDLARCGYDGRNPRHGEVLKLPVMMIVPGAALGTIGGVVGATIKRLRSA